MSIDITTEKDGKLRQRVSIDSFNDLLVDVPTAFGGDGLAPDPHDYFDLSLGACKAITSRMYAQRKEWPLEGVSVKVTRDERDERKGVYRLDVAMTFHGIEAVKRNSVGHVWQENGNFGKGRSDEREREGRKACVGSLRCT